MKNLILSFVAISFLSACAPQSPESTTISGRKTIPQPARPEIPQYQPVPRDEAKWITLDGGQSQVEFNPNVDILFVIDNSESMKSAQQNLVTNINSFASGLQKNKLMDYHIGVTTVWDNSDAFQKNSQEVYKNGELRKINGLSQRFVTKSNSNSRLLAQALNVGIAPLAQGGPEVEEVFSPILASLQTTNTGRGGANEGFFRDNAQLVIVILTDADDSSQQITAEQLAAELHSFKKGKADKVSVYAALVKASDSDDFKDYGLKVHPTYHPECFTGKKDNGKCKGFGPVQIEKFVVLANSAHGTPEQIREKNLMSLVQKNFSQDLLKIGNDIAVKTLSKRILLNQRPRIINGEHMLRVRYNSVLVKNSAQGGWVYNVADNSIEISGDVDYIEGATFQVDMIPEVVIK